MEINRITNKLRLSVYDSVRFQIITQTMFFKNMVLTPTELKILISLAITGEIELGSFCNTITKEIYDIKKMEEFPAKSQNIRNIITKLTKRGLIDKSSGIGKKTIKLNSEIEVFYEDNILLDYNFLSTNETIKA